MGPSDSSRECEPLAINFLMASFLNSFERAEGAYGQLDYRMKPIELMSARVSNHIDINKGEKESGFFADGQRLAKTFSTARWLGSLRMAIGRSMEGPLFQKEGGERSG